MQRVDLDQWRAREVARLLSLVEAERRYYQEIVASVPVGLAVLDSDLSFLSVNRSFRRAFGLSADKIAGMRLSDLFPGEEIRERLAQVLAKATSLPSFSITYETPEGSKPLRIAAEPFLGWSDEGGKQALLLVEDLSLAEAPLEEKPEEVVEEAGERPGGDLLENIEAILWERDAESLAFTYVGGRAEQILGYPSEEWLSKPDFYFERIHPEDREWVSAFYRATVSAGGSRSCEYRAVAADGRTLWLRDVIRVVHDETGRAVKLSGITVDVNGPKLRAERLMQAEKMAALGRLAGKVTHDCNNLLMILSGYSEELLENIPPGHPARGDVEEILAATERLSKVTGELLAFTRRPVLARKVFRVNSLVEGIEPRIKGELGDRIELVVHLEEDAGQVDADQDQLGDSLLTLIRHLRERMPDGGRLSVATANVDLSDASVGDGKALPAGSYVQIVLSDTGPKLDEETKSRFFEPFFSPAASSQDLPSVYHLITSSGGDIVVSSGEEAGAVFTIYLPRVKQAAVKEEKPPAALTAPQPAEEVKPRETVLVVEDEGGIRALIRKILQKQGYRVFEASRAEEALRIADERPEPIHLLLTDVIMPGMNGRELADRLTSMRPELKVLFISGYSDEELAGYGPLPEGAAFLQKPFSLATLLDRTRAVLNGTSN